MKLQLIPKTLRRGFVNLDLVGLGINIILRRRASYLDRILPARRIKGYRQVVR